MRARMTKVAIKMKLLLTAFLLFTISLCLPVYAQDAQTVTLSTTVTGNQEQPKVLYIVPWQPAEDNTLLYQALNRNSADSIFGHIERSEHQREIEFLGELEGESE